MQTEETVFETTYKNYLEQLREISFESIAHNLGAKIEGNRIKIPLLRFSRSAVFRHDSL